MGKGSFEKTLCNSTTTPPLNYTSPYSSAAAPAYIDTNYISCTQQSSPVAQVPSISGISFDQVDYNSSSCFEPIYYTTNTSDVSLCQDNFYGNTVTTSEKSVDDWIQYLHSDDEEGCSPSYEQESLGINCDSLFPEFAEEDLTMLDTILAEETFSDSVTLPFHPQQQDMPAGSSAASPQYQYLPEEQPQQSQAIQYIPIAPKPADFQPAQSQSPTSSTSSSTTTTDKTNQRSRKRQRIVFNNSEEEYRIKRDLNNAASAKSREKKRQHQEFMKLEKVRLESRNRQLKNEVEEFERQIATLKDILYSKIKK
uniref:BZIP domain-containing protein n=1 Tax=Panagrolaimus sp. PS1159 TaxID=55785 RepID=A0AC35FWV8_9BILA